MNLVHPWSIVQLLPKSFEEYWYVSIAIFWLIVVILFGFLFVLRVKAAAPGKMQSVLEIIIVGIHNQALDILGKDGMKFFPLCFAMGLYAIVCNIGGVIPGLLSSTASLNATVPPALIIFVLYNFLAIKKHGLHYFEHMMGPAAASKNIIVKILGGIPMLLIELLSHITRPITHSARLYGNMMGGDLLILIMILLTHYLVPVPIMLFEVFEVILQAYVYMLLSMIYIGGAIEDIDEF